MLSQLQLAALALGRAKGSRRVPCQYCAAATHFPNLKRHEAACYANPFNHRPCPVCGKQIRDKYTATCGYGCANTLFRSGKAHWNWKEAAYRSTCFLHHDKRCVICGEERIVEVHHMNEDKHDNRPENLIPLCPTHHQYWHSRHRHLIEAKIIAYLSAKFLALA